MTILPLSLPHGLTLDEDDHTVTLKDGDKVIARFGFHATIKAIGDAVDRYLAEEVGPND